MTDNHNNNPFRSSFSETIFKNKYAHKGAETWAELCDTLVEQVCGQYMDDLEKTLLKTYMTEMKFIPGGRYLYYAGRDNPFFNNCYLLRAEEDTREDWANLSWKAESALMTGGGIGIDYSRYRASGSLINKTGGLASGPIPKMLMINEIGRRVMQGGSRRSAIYGSLALEHPDAEELLYIKDWSTQVIKGAGGLTVGDLKRADFNYAAPLDLTNISLNYGTDWLMKTYKDGWDHNPLFRKHVAIALENGEPGFSFNFFDKEGETLRNACTEVTSSDDSDVCNLGSLNMGRIKDLKEFMDVTHLATKFLLCGTLVAKLPYQKVYEIREKNRRLGLGLMGVHEWLLKRGYRYEVVSELHQWLHVYEGISDSTADNFADDLGISRPVAKRAIAPTGTIGILAGTTTGIEPLFAVAYQRRYLRGEKDWRYQMVIDGTAKELIETHNLDPESIESAIDLANDPERRIKFQADVQGYVDQAISSTINLPRYGSPENNPGVVDKYCSLIAKYAPRLRGLTVYPDGSRGGQPLTPVPYRDAKEWEGKEFKEGEGPALSIQTHDICDITGKGGTCGV